MRLETRTVTALSAGIGALTLAATPAISQGTADFSVTITNLTAGQPLTPPVLVTHTDDAAIFHVGEPASPEIQSIAENGNNLPLVTALLGNVEVLDVVEGTAPLVPAHDPGGSALESSASFTVTASRDARFLSYISMLICTNDGFAGVDSMQLPLNSATFYALSYETRTEHNTEDLNDIVPPCQGLMGLTSDKPGAGMSNPLIAEDGIVIPHAGIQGSADLDPSVHDWADPVAKIVIERIRPNR